MRLNGLIYPVTTTHPLETAGGVKVAGPEYFRIGSRGGPLLGRGAPVVASPTLVPPAAVQTWYISDDI